MSPNASLSPQVLENDQAVDVNAIMVKVSVVLYMLTVVLGISGNALVIWVARFKLKVDTHRKM